VVQAFAAEEREMEKFKEINKEHRNANIRSIFAYSVFYPVVELVLALSLGLLVWWAAKESLLVSADKAAEFGGIVTSFILCLNLLFPINDEHIDQYRNNRKKIRNDRYQTITKNIIDRFNIINGTGG